MEIKEIIEKYMQDLQKTTGELPKEDIEKVVDALFKAWKNSNHVFIIGNGGSASTASHFACDLSKWTIVEGKKRFKATALVDNIPWVSALTNDDGWENVYVEQLKNLFKEGDVVIAISVHGGSGKDKAGLWSQNLLKALQYAKDNKGVAIGLAGFDGGAMKEMADCCIVVPVDSTPIVESLHATLEHLICMCLKDKIEDE